MSEDPKIHIFINDLDGKICTFEVTRSMTVYELKRMIKTKIYIHTDQQRLIYGGKMLLYDDKQLFEYNILPDSSLHLLAAPYINKN